MKLITLNVWGGKLYVPLINFIKNNSDIDIFCFQDALFGSKPEFSPIQKGRINLFDEIKKVLPNHNYFIDRDPKESFIHGEILPLEVGCGRVIFVNKKIKVLDNGTFQTHESSYHKGGDMVGGKCQWIKIDDENIGEVTVLNLHGIWQRDTKKADTKERLEQSNKIQNFFKSVTGKKILCGDFNIILDGNAMAVLEEGMINLVKKYKVTSTRSSHYPKEEKFADYVLVSPNTKVNDFRVSEDEVSDHLPLFFDFE